MTETTNAKPGRIRVLLGAWVNRLIDRVFAGNPPAPPCRACGGQGCKHCAWLGSECGDEDR